MLITDGSEFDAAKADLAARVAALDVRAPYCEAGELAADVDAIRDLACRNRLDPAVTVAHYLNTALAHGDRSDRGDRSALVHGWLSMLSAALASERQDAAACDAFAAACSKRLAS